MKSERLSSNDSGIECEEGYRTRGSLASDDDEADSDKQISSDSRDMSQGTLDHPQPNSCDAAPNSSLGDGPLDHPDSMNEYRTSNDDLDGFLDPSQSYLFPNFNHVVQGGLMILTLEVKNVAPDTVQYKVGLFLA